MITVLLYGHLAKRFGKRFKLAVKTPAEAIRALCVICPGFKRYVAENSAPGYRVLVDKDARDKDELLDPLGSAKAIKIVPVVAGTGPVVKIIVGALLIVWSFFPQFGGQPWMFNMGVSMVLGGVSEMLFTAPKPPSAGNNERPDNQPSYTFDGAVNTAAQGNPIPLCYGRLIVGSQVVSAGLAVEQIA